MLPRTNQQHKRKINRIVAMVNESNSLNPTRYGSILVEIISFVVQTVCRCLGETVVALKRHSVIGAGTTQDHSNDSPNLAGL